MAPLWLTIAMGPMQSGSSRKPEAKVVISRVGRCAMPWQFGPTMRSPVRWASAVRRACASRPAPPTSANPLLKTMAARTPWTAAASRAGSTASAGTTTTARSTGAGTSEMDAKAGSPCTVVRDGFTG